MTASSLRPARRAPRAIAAVFVAALGVSPSPARAELRVAWDCYVESGPVTCTNLERAFFSSLHDLAPADGSPRPAEAAITLRSVAASTGTHYVVSFAGTGDGPAFTMREFVRGQLDGDTALLLLVSLLQRGIIPYVPLAEPMTDDGAALRVRPLREGRASRATAQPEPRRWSVSPSLWGHVRKAGGFTAQVGGDVALQWSFPTWQARATAWGDYQRLRYDLGDEVVSGAFASGGGSARGVVDLGHGLDLALGAGGLRAVHGNYDGIVELWLGLEWLHRAWLETSGTNFGLRVRAGGMYADYHVVNVLEEARGLYGKPWAEAFVRLHTEAVDLTASLSGWMLVPETRFSELGAYVEPTWHVTQGLELSCWGSVTLRRHAIQEPRDPDALGAAATLAGGNDFGSVSYRGGFSATLVLGNALVRSQDQRWR